MGIFDNMSGAMDRGVAAVGRTTKSAQLKAQLTSLERRRKELAAQLGASLYEATRDDEVFRAGREALYDGIGQIDTQREDLNAQIRALEEEALAQQRARVSMSCPNCGMGVSEGDLFCSGCGMSAADMKAEIARRQAAAQATRSARAATCPTCGHEISEGDLFCCSCGAPVDAARAGAMQQPVPIAGALCPICGAKVAEDDRFCMSCGAPVPAEAADPAPAESEQAAPSTPTDSQPGER